MSFVAVAIGAAVVGGAVKYAGARKNELKANFVNNRLYLRW